MFILPGSEIRHHHLCLRCKLINEHGRLAHPTGPVMTVGAT